MKRIISIVILVFMLSTLLAGCSSTVESQTETGTNTEQNASEQTTTEVALEPVVLKFGMVAGNQSNEYLAAEKFAGLVNEKSEGAITVELFPNSQLGDDRAMIEQVGAGVLDMTLAETARLGIWVPRAELTGLSYMFDDFDHLKRVLYETEFGTALHEEFYNNFNWHILTTAYNGTRQTSSNRPISSIEDMKGLKLRTPQHQPLLDYAEFVGATPTPMAFTEVYLALQTNAVDAQENPLSTIKSVKFYEVQENLAITNHMINDVNYLFSKQTWEKLPEAYQVAITEAAQEAGEYHTSLFDTQEQELIAFFEGEGVNITYPELAPFKEALKGSYQKYFDKIGDGVEAALEAIESVR